MSDRVVSAEITELAHKLVSRTERVFILVWFVILLPGLTSVKPARYRQALPAVPISIDDDLLDRMKAFPGLNLAR